MLYEWELDLDSCPKEKKKYIKKTTQEVAQDEHLKNCFDSKI